MKQFYKIVLHCMIFFLMFFNQVSAAENGTCASGLIKWVKDDATIRFSSVESDYVPLWNSKSCGDNLFKNDANITKVYIDSPIRIEFLNAFNGYQFVEEMHLSNFIADDPNMCYAFMGCTALKILDISTMDTSMVTDMLDAFKDCSSLTNLDLSGWDTGNVTRTPFMFENCTKLQSLDLSGWDTSKVTDMSGMFSGCSSLTELTLGDNWDTSTTTDLSYMFSGCSSLQSLDVRNWDTAKAANLNSMFAGCTSLESLDLNNWTSPNVKNMSRMFDGCSALTSLDINNWKVSNFEDSSFMFRNCSKLTSLDLNLWKTDKAITMRNMFQNCSNLASVQVDKWNTQNLKSIHYMFDGCSSLTSLDISGWDSKNVTTIAQNFHGCNALTTLTLGQNSLKNNIFNPYLPKFSNAWYYIETDPALTDPFAIGTSKTGRDFLMPSTYNYEKMGGTWSTKYVLAEDVTVTYDGLSHGIKVEPKNLTNANVMYGTEEGTYELTESPAITEAGDSTLRVYYQVTADDYKTVTGSAVVTINKKDITISAENKTKVYGENDPALTAKVTGVPENGIPPVYSLSRSTGENVNTYEITVDADAASNPNYSVTVTPGTFVITPADITVTADNKIKFLDTEDPDLTWKADGLVNGDDKSVLSVNISRESGEEIGTYTITPAGDAVQGNYSVAFQTGTFSIVASEDDQVCGRGTVKYASAGDTIIFSKKHESPVWDSDCVAAFSENEKIKKVVIVDEIMIDDNMPRMFTDCQYVEEMDLSNLTIPADQSSMNSMFDGCSELKMLNLSGWDTSNVENMSWMFHDCSKLTTLDLTDWNTSSVENMSNMFSECGSLQELDLSGLETSGVTDMAWMFNNCSSLTTLNLDRWDTSQVEDMSSMFSDCSSLTTLNIDGWTLSENWVDMTEMFSGCSKLESLDLSSWDTYNAIDYPDIFIGCNALRTLTLGENTLNDNSFFESLPSYRDAWKYIKAAEIAEDHMDVGTILTDGHLFDDYKYLEMAGTWTSDITYTVTWVDGNGKILKTEQVLYGKTPVYEGENPTKTTTAQYTYSFNGTWSPEIVPVTDDAVYTAQFDSTVNQYTITWKDGDDKTLKIISVPYGEIPEYPGRTPTKTPTAQYTYIFNDTWAPAIVSVTEDTVYTAQFDIEVNEYLITWKDGDGNTLKTEPFPYGETPEYEGDIPTKTPTIRDTFVFNGAWSPNIIAVTEDASYTAQFDTVIRKYTVIFMDDDGTTVLKEATEYPFGTAPENIVKPNDPTKPATEKFIYTFAGWDPEITSVTSDMIYTAVYKSTALYKITITTDGNGTADAVLEKGISKAADETEVIGPTGTKVNLTAQPNEGYEFKEWKVLAGSMSIENNSFTIGTEDVFILALFEKSGGETCQIKVNVKAGENGSASIVPSPDGVPTLTAKPNTGYQLKEWRFLTGAVQIVDDHTFIIGNGNADLQAVFEKSEKPVPPVPPKPDPKGMDFFLLEGELPLTGITAPKGEPKPLSVNYKPVNMELQIPGLNVTSDIVTVPVTADGYAVAWLGNDAGLLEGFALPGEGVSVIAGHNTLNAEEFGPFAAIRQLDEGERFFVRDARGKLMTYEVYANEKIGSHDADALQKTALVYENTLTLLTCEDELSEGGYASRRIVSAKYID